MNTIKINKKNALMVAHIGLGGLETYNSIPGFVAAGNRTYYGIEADMRITADGRFVMFHDEKTGKMTQEDLEVETSSFEELRRLRLKDQKDAEWDRIDLVVPSLEEYIRICKKYEKKCVLEIKSELGRESIEALLAIIREQNYLENVIFIAFSLENLIILRELLPEQELQWLTFDCNQEIAETLDKYQLDIDVNYKAMTKEWIDELHLRGHKVNIWTVDDGATGEQFAAWGVEFITTNTLE